MSRVKRLFAPYTVERRAHTRYYVGLLTSTTALLTFSIVLDIARFHLATQLMQLGSLALIITVALGVAERLRASAGSGGLAFAVVDALSTTSYGVLPFFVAGAAIIFYLGGPTEAFFANLKVVVTGLGMLVALPALLKLAAVQIPTLLRELRDSLVHIALFYVSTILIVGGGTTLYRFAYLVLPPSLLAWYMYLTFLFFLELLFLYVSAEAAYRHAKDFSLFSLASYVAVTTFSVLGIVEGANLSLGEYPNLFPKFVTGIVLLGANGSIMDARLSALLVNERRGREEEAGQPYAGLIDELTETVKRMQQEIRLNRALVERQQDALSRLYDLAEKAASRPSDTAYEDIRRELRELREITIRATRDPLEELFEQVRDAVLRGGFRDREEMKRFVAFLVGPAVPEPLLSQSKRYRDVDDASPLPLLVLLYLAAAEVETGREVRALKKVGLASFLVTRHPKFKGGWGRRTAQDFVADIFTGYFKPNREMANILLKEMRGEEVIQRDGVAGEVLRGLKEYMKAVGGEKDPTVAVHGLKKLGAMLAKEFGVSAEELPKFAALRVFPGSEARFG